MKTSPDRNIIRQRKAFDNNEVLLADVRYKKIYNLLKKFPKRKVLEIGCSDGEFLKLLKVEGWEVKGLEVSKKAVQKARKKGIDADVCDVNNKLPLKDNSFDVIVAGEVMEHLFEDLDFLDECHRVLKEEGILIVTTPNLISLKNRILMFLGFNPRYAIDDHHYHVYTPRLIKNLFKRSKFNKTKIKGNFIIYSSGREKILGTFFEKLAEFIPEWAEHFIIISRK